MKIQKALRRKLYERQIKNCFCISFHGISVSACLRVPHARRVERSGSGKRRADKRTPLLLQRQRGKRRTVPEIRFRRTDKHVYVVLLRDRYITDTFRANFKKGDYNDISNSYVIFEMASAGFPTETDDGSTTLFTDDLTDFFSYLKTNGCKIMFISATDEARYIHYNDFLDYVDIHVKTDIFFKFITSVLYHAAQDCENGGKIWGTTFFLDAGLIDYENLPPLSQSVFGYYFIPYLAGMYQDELNGEPVSLSDFIARKDIKLFCNTTGANYLDLIYRDHYSRTTNTSDLYDAASNAFYCGAGTNWKGEAYTENWLYEMCEMQGMLDNYFPVYFYGSNAYPTEIIPANLCTTGQIALTTIYTDFISGEDMTPYNNTSGRCVITHSPTQANEEGWLIDILDYDLEYEWNFFIERIQVIKQIDETPLNFILDI